MAPSIDQMVIVNPSILMYLQLFLLFFPCFMESAFAGPLSNGYQQSPANFSMSSGGNISSVGGQRIASQMIPTPGFSGISNQSYTNLESSSNGGGFSTVESTMVSQPQPQRQHIVGQNNNGGGQNNMLPQLPVMSQQNGNALPQMQNLSGSSRPMDPDFVRARHFMQEKM